MKRRAPNLGANDVRAIVAIIDGWSEPEITWRALLERISDVLHVRYVRQTLHKYPQIASAFSRRRANRTVAPVPSRASMGDLRLARDRIGRLEAENKRLIATNDALLERFVTWSYNASLFGLDELKLDRPIPPASRT